MISINGIVGLCLPAISAEWPRSAGRAKPLQGGGHLALLAAFVFLSIQP